MFHQLHQDLQQLLRLRKLRTVTRLNVLDDPLPAGASDHHVLHRVRHGVVVLGPLRRQRDPRRPPSPQLADGMALLKERQARVQAGACCDLGDLGRNVLVEWGHRVSAANEVTGFLQ